MEFQLMDSDSASQPYYWRIIADNNRELARSELLTSKSYARTAAETLKNYGHTSKYSYNVVRSNSPAQQWRWNVTAANHEKVVASTENYYNYADAQTAAESVRQNARYAKIVDKTRSSTSSYR
jgi:uncharacterized protein YegP (UPF0339 family)